MGLRSPCDSSNHVNQDLPRPLDTRALLAEASRCVKCGTCLSVCPIYRETLREPDVARGKLALIEAALGGEIVASPERLKKSISCCLLCGACAEKCPNLVSGDAILRKAREVLLAKNLPSSPCQIFLRNVLPCPERMDRLHQAGKLLSPLLFKAIPQESGLRLRFPLGRDQKNRLIPQLASKPFLKSYSPTVSSTPLLALFVGCVSNYLLSRIAHAVTDILHHAQLEFHVPRKQACCGLMGFGVGDTEVARSLAKENITAFEPTGTLPIVAFCSSCSSHLKQYAELFEEGQWKQKAFQFSKRVMDFSEYFTEMVREDIFVNKGAMSARRVTFHDPCHLRRKQEIYNEPRALLRLIKGAQFVETGYDNLCCGSGGSFALSHYDISQRIFRRRLRPVQDAKADTVVTSCMGCLLQFKDGLHREDKGIQVKHLAEILAQALPGKKL